MENSPLSRLPPELRLRIYEFTLHQSYFNIGPYKSFKGPPRSDHAEKHHLLALAKTCKAINRECVPVLYSINSFHILGRHTKSIVRLLSAFREAIGEKNTAALNSIVLEIGMLTMESFETVFASLDEFQLLLRETKLLSESTDWKCSFRARGRFIICVRQFCTARFILDLDFNDIEKSWDDNMMLLADQTSEEQIAGWQRFAPWLQNLRRDTQFVQKRQLRS